jgi:hypothetical protein
MERLNNIKNLLSDLIPMFAIINLADRPCSLNLNTMVGKQAAHGG